MHNRSPAPRPLVVRLLGPRGNPLAAGAQLTVHITGGARHTMEAYSGGGYLSQSSRDFFVTGPAGHSIESIAVRWPDGRETVHENDDWQGLVELAPPVD
jgi:hypothetical protein